MAALAFKRKSHSGEETFMKLERRILSIVLCLILLIGTLPSAVGVAFATLETDLEKNEASIAETGFDAESDNKTDGLYPEDETEEQKKEQKEEPITEEGGKEQEQAPSSETTKPSLKKAPENTSSKAAPTGIAKLSGSAKTYLSLVDSTFIFFKTDNILLETSDDSFEYRVIVQNVNCPAGGSYQWDSTNYTEADNAEFTIKDADTHKKYVVTYQAQYMDPDDNEWKDLDGVSRETEIIVRGDSDKKYVSGDEAYVERIQLNMVASGTPDFDDDNEPGNDMDASNDIVRSFDTVKYVADFNTLVVDDYDTYSHGYLWVEIDLPCTRDIAAIDTTVFPTAVKQAKEPKEIVKEDGKTHTIYTFYYEKITTVEEDGHVNHALPQVGHFPFTMKVFGAKNGTTIKPVVGMAVAQLELDENGEAKKDAKGNYIVARDYSDFEGAYDTPKYAEGPDIKVSAKPGFNISLNRFQQQGTSRVYDFSQGTDDAIDREAGQVFGRGARFGILVQMRNEDTSKGLKGLELPDGNDISFELDMEAAFGTDAADAPLIWSVHNTGGSNQYERGSTGSYSLPTYAPRDLRKGPNEEFTARPSASVSMWNGGDWTLERTGNGKIKVTISDYVVNPLWFPTGYNASGNSSYYFFMSGGEHKYGVFSARNIDIVIPFGSNITDAEGNPRADGVSPEYATNSDDPKYYPNLYDRDGYINITIKDSNLEVTSQSGQKTSELYPGEKEGQTVYNNKEDRIKAEVLLARGSGLNSRTIYFGKSGSTAARDVNGQEYAITNGRDAVMPGRLIRIAGSIVYTHRDTYETTWFGAGQVLVKFDDEHLTPQQNLGEGVFFATKPDGNGWDSDDEMKRTGIDQLEYYSSIEELQASGKVCVGILKEVRETGDPKEGNQGFTVHCQNLLVTTDRKYYNTVSMTSMCTRLWRKDAYDKIKELNGEFPSYANSEMQGKTVEEYIAQKYELSDEGKAAIAPSRDDLKSKNNLGYIKSSYDEEGFHKGSGTESTWGDSLYIIPYKMGIRKFVEQKNGPNSTDSVGYSFEHGETIADFCLTPYFEMPENDTDIELSGATTKVTITDVLPEGLDYMPGSAYIGGTYQNNTTNRGGHGEVIEGTQVEPIIEEQEDGTTILKWEIDNAIIGDNDSIPAIHFSANIDQEIEEATNWINTGRVRSTEDNRGYSSYNDNLDTAKINAAPSGNFIIKKIAKHRFNDHDQDLEWTLRWKNTTSQNYAKRVLIDVLPYNGDPRGTKFNGSYTITELNYKFLNGLNASNFRFYYTTDPEARTASAFANGIDYDGLAGDNPTAGGILWHKAEIAEDGTVSAVVGNEDIAAFLVAGDVQSQGEVRATVTIKPEGNKPGDHYVNAIAVNDMMQGSRVDIIKRGLRGTVWREDEDSVDGSRQLNELKLGNVKVVLKKQNSAGEWKEYATTITDKGGRYEFSDLPAGKFRVEFVNSGDRSLSNYFATTQNAEGVAASHNSDASPLYDDEVFAVIEDIEMPAAVDMNTSPYYVEYQDLGVWRPDLTVSKTVDASADENEAAADRDFLFKLSVPGGGDEEFFEIFDAQGESLGKVTGAQLKKGYIFKLKHGESVRFAELPANVDYALEEYDYETNGYGYKKSLADDSDAMTGTLNQSREVNVINTYAPETVDISVSKKWDETDVDSNSNYVRPESIKATLVEDGVATEKHKVLNEDNKWAGSFEGLPKYNRETWPDSFDAGAAKEISYAVEETLVGDESFVVIDGERRFYFYNEDESVLGYFVSTSEDGSIVNKFVPVKTNESGILKISKHVNKDAVNEGETLEYTLVVTNIGDGVAENSVVWDVLPEQIAYISDDSNGVYSLEDGKERIDWHIERLEPGETKEIHMVTLVKECSSGEDIVNVAFVKNSTIEETSEDDTKTKVRGTVVEETVETDVKGAKTGDENSVMLVAMIFAASLAAYLMMARKRRRKKM
jgi:uncharacterized repeat protein (TIGR01451 family)/LPXTG-motif cell wall-anchored protein